jgi:membrane associated rhomboid family serine protease/Tfp pilus assembly protein PilF
VRKKTFAKSVLTHSCNCIPDAKRTDVFDLDLDDREDTPWFTATKLLIAINCMVFVAMLASGVSAADPNVDEMLRWGAGYAPYTLTTQPWRLLTQSFLHVGIIHLLLNMFCLWIYGKLAEKLLGYGGLIAVYVLTGIGAGLLSLSYETSRVSAGASGPLFGISGALISIFYFGNLNLSPERIRHLLMYVVRFTVINLIYGLTAGIDNVAHIGGLVTGLLIGMGLARTINRPLEKSAWTALGVFVVSGAILSATYFSARQAKKPELSVMDAQDAIAQSRYEEAISKYQEVVRLRPNDADAYQQLGWLWYMEERYDESIAAYQRSLAIRPGDARVEQDLGDVYFHAENYELAEPFFRKALERGVDQDEAATFHYEYANLLLELNKRDEARPALAKAVEANQSASSSRLLALAAMADELGDKRTAISLQAKAKIVREQEEKEEKEVSESAEKEPLTVQKN